MHRIEHTARKKQQQEITTTLRPQSGKTGASVTNKLRKNIPYRHQSHSRDPAMPEKPLVAEWVQKQMLWLTPSSHLPVSTRPPSHWSNPIGSQLTRESGKCSPRGQLPVTESKAEKQEWIWGQSPETALLFKEKVMSHMKLTQKRSAGGCPTVHCFSCPDCS